MAIVRTVHDDYEFWQWLKATDRTNFSMEGAVALQQYIEQLSDDMDEPIEFDPIAWCVEYTEYDSVEEAYREHYGDDSDLPESQRRTQRDQQLEYFTDNTQVIELDNGGIIIQDF